jgi:hypothetical protein
MLDILAKVVAPTSPCVPLYGIEILEITLWFLERISINFETRYISPDSEWPLVTGLL